MEVGVRLVEEVPHDGEDRPTYRYEGPALASSTGDPLRSAKQLAI